MENEFEWTHKSGVVVKRLPEEKVLSIYDGHEIASHTLTHTYLEGKRKDEIMVELKEDKKNLETLFGREISSQDDVLPMTTIEIIDYLKAMEQVEITDSYIINNSEQSLWFSINETVYQVSPKSKIAFK